MIIFLPFKKELNTYLDEIQRYSQYTFVYENYKKYTATYNIVNVHWPEAIFDWFEPTDEQLADLRNEINKWKKNSVLIYTKHDVERHKGMTPNFTKLFELIEQNTDVFIHLGNYSKEYYQEKYPNATHKIVFHPLYENSFMISSKSEAREKLNIDQEALVIISPGSIRNFAERNLVISSFKKLKVKNKVLIATNMRSEIKYDFRGRVKLKKFFDIRSYFVNRFKNNHQPPRFIFSYNRINANEMALKMSAADIVLIPRIKILNSGNLFLGLTFNKIVVGPATGNIEEQLNLLRLPVFDSNSISSVTQAIEKGIVLNNSGYVIPNKDLSKFKPENVAKDMDFIFAEFIQ
tara:strand:+ start:9816 stop:10859 length:1044 start_codon:yes stop_codon:yes gene_type:complete